MTNQLSRTPFLPFFLPILSHWFKVTVKLKDNVQIHGTLKSVAHLSSRLQKSVAPKIVCVAGTLTRPKLVAWPRLIFNRPSNISEAPSDVVEVYPHRSRAVSGAKAFGSPDPKIRQGSPAIGGPLRAMEIDLSVRHLPLF